MAELFRREKSDEIVSLINPRLRGPEKEAIAMSVLTAMEKIRSWGGLDQAKLLNVLTDEQTENTVPLYLPFLINKQIRTIKADDILAQDEGFFLNGALHAGMPQADPDLTEGYRLYRSKCLVCHGSIGEGGVGPNLTDDYWKYVTNEEELFQVIKEGRKGTVMMAFREYLNDDEIRKVIRFLNLVHGQQMVQGKGPEGQRVVFTRHVY
ncbi:MAG: cytochrome c [Chlorobi bacterium]|nr:cytochrome c [Chlorobiota bacterium]